MSVGSFNSSNLGVASGYSRSYEAELLQKEEDGTLKEGKGSVTLVDGKLVPNTPQTTKEAAAADKKKDEKGDKGEKGAVGKAGGSASKQSVIADENKKAELKSQIGKSDEAKSTVKAAELKAVINNDSITKVEANKQSPVELTSLGNVRFEEVNLSKQEAENAYNTGVLVTEVVTDLLNKCGGDFSKLSGEDLLAAFMKIQLADPAKNTDTLNDLNDLMKDMRKMAHRNEQAQLKKQEVEQKKAIKEAEKAQKYGAFAKIFKIVAIVVAVVVAVVVTAATWGSAGPLMAIGLGLLIGAITAGVSVGAANMKQAELNLKATEQAAKATEAQIAAMDFDRVKEIFQEMVGDNQELLQAIMETFNQFCNVLKALIDRQGATAKVLSDATMR